ncbi:MAG: hypothetical protein LKE40_09865 [Spirochaetia bacterium]|jgi:hypothetical protein|nr:hypothetical protein [Spirochaetia bacterium]
MDRRKTNRIALGTINILAFAAIVILVVILSYLVFRGFYSSAQKERTVLNTVDQDLPFGVYAAKKSHIRELDWFTLRNMGEGNILTLRSLTSVNKMFELIALDE